MSDCGYSRKREGAYSDFLPDQQGYFHKGGKKTAPEPYHRCASIVLKMLGKQEYCGDIINFKTYSKSYKNKKRFENDKENWVIFKDVHEPIIERSVWELVQEKRGRKAKRKKVDGERNMFSGLLICADCGSNLGFHDELPDNNVSLHTRQGVDVHYAA